MKIFPGVWLFSSELKFSEFSAVDVGNLIQTQDLPPLDSCLFHPRWSIILSAFRCNSGVLHLFQTSLNNSENRRNGTEVKP